MKLTVNQIFKKAEQEIKKSNFKNAIYFYKSISKIEPLNFNAYKLTATLPAPAKPPNKEVTRFAKP